MRNYFATTDICLHLLPFTVMSWNVAFGDADTSHERSTVRVTVDVDGRRLVYDADSLDAISFTAGT
ncbi:MAG: hypothetical protein ABEI98_00695 [Halorhabdus sp.]